MTGFDFAAALEGFLLGAGLIIAIDVQNAFVLRQGLLRQHVLPVALVCSFADALLIAAGVGGFGRLVQTVPLLLTTFTALGAGFLFFYGAVAFRNALHPGVLQASAADKASLGTVLAACLAFTFLNPHVYLDTLVLIGASSARFATQSAIAFGIGATLASIA
jgi:L-lysine exporter family protein LysE/ArgO